MAGATTLVPHKPRDAESIPRGYLTYRVLSYETLERRGKTNDGFRRDSGQSENSLTYPEKKWNADPFAADTEQVVSFEGHGPVQI